MHIQNDFREFLRLLRVNNVEFVILGGYAVAFHGYVRNTQDLDILFRKDEFQRRENPADRAHQSGPRPA